MIISNKSLLKPALFLAGVSLFLAGCTNPDDDSTTPPPTSTTGATADSGAGATAVAFSTVHETLKTRCIQCHNGPSGKEGVDFTSYESIMKGGKEGPIVKANDPENSLIIQVVRGVEGHPKMPPTGDPLTEEQIKSIEDWIRGGAPNS